ncbi:MAG: hypothetical protein HGA33_00140 [Candidatus Moranbacteria bacterium]|nr:hypothetical protein [Candidatus Moranbacteria bacterium]
MSDAIQNGANSEIKCAFFDTFDVAAQKVIDHAARRNRRGKGPSMRFFDEPNPKIALRFAEEFLHQLETRDYLSQLWVSFVAMRRIADLSFDFYATDSHTIRSWVEDRRNQVWVNPYYSQTTGGLFFEMSGGIPQSIWTPWGKWSCWGRGCRYDSQSITAFLTAIGEVHLYQERIRTTGPIYQIIRVGSIVLPEPLLRNSGSCIGYEEAKRQWETLRNEYERIHHVI